MHKKKVAVQGFKGCFHQEAAEIYFGTALDIVETISFDELAKSFTSDSSIDFAIMAIENSIAGSILQNYRILRENRFRIIGEIYMAIHHNLMVLPGTTLTDLEEICSHPMALNQCLKFLSPYDHVRLIESEDTALSAKRVREGQLKNVAAIASRSAASLYQLEILSENIETSKVNFTRFFILQRDDDPIPTGIFNKASIYCRVGHEPGSLLKTLEVLQEFNVNLSKLQSFPVLGKLSEYYFHMDLEFFKMDQYESVINKLDTVTLELEVLGLYNKGLYV